MLSSRLDSQGAELSRHRTGFLLYKVAAGWRIAAVLADLAPSTEIES
jgi:hypothetical protein